MKKIVLAALLTIATYQANASSVLNTNWVLSSGTDTYSFTSSTPFTLTFDLLTPLLDTFTLSLSLKDADTNNLVYSTYFDMNTDSFSIVSPVIQAGAFASTVQFNYPADGSVSVQYQLSLTPVPVPSTFYLLSSALIGLLGIAKKK